MTPQQTFEHAFARHRAGDFSGAELAYRQVLAHQANHVGAMCGLIEVLYRLGRAAEALGMIGDAINVNPTEPALRLTRGIVLNLEGRFEEAIAEFRQALVIRPDLAEAYSQIATPLLAIGRATEAIAACRRSLSLRPDHMPTIGVLCSALSGVGNLDEVIGICRDALWRHPEFRALYINLGWALREQGRVVEAINCYREALAAAPHKQIHNDLLFTLHFHGGYGRRELLEEHRRWAQIHAEPLRAGILAHKNDRSAERKIRLGYVAHELGNNPLGRFMLPLLENHDLRGFEVFCYCNRRRADSVGDRLAGSADVWRATGALSDEQLATLIRADRIDVLVDLVMHSNGSRLLAFARKPAPVQVTYLAYCSTTGLDTIDYRFTDRYLDPDSNDLDADYSEKSIRLPNCYWCYPPPGESPEVGPPPASCNGYVTFGCLNEFSKVNAAVFATWFGLLRQVPNSRLILHAKPGSQRARALEQAGREGLDPGRLEFVGRLGLGDYFAQYNRIDIALDPFPYAGGTTTFDALWMGVPVITLAGQTAVGRGGVSILSNLGLDHWIAPTIGRYVAAAVELASDINAIGVFRQDARRRMLASGLTDGPRFARDVETAFREMWRGWCERQK
ncbi:MAG TPA: tetratricopeptide repeat protein [Tepidisphaeraceae bacterium]|jgi:predicted O-linked N-acetylglucosamine transferase (SPINDLY family)